MFLTAPGSLVTTYAAILKVISESLDALLFYRLIKVFGIWKNGRVSTYFINFVFHSHLIDILHFSLTFNVRYILIFVVSAKIIDVYHVASWFVSSKFSAFVVDNILF